MISPNIKTLMTGRFAQQKDSRLGNSPDWSSKTRLLSEAWDSLSQAGDWGILDIQVLLNMLKELDAAAARIIAEDGPNSFRASSYAPKEILAAPAPREERL